MEKNKHQSHNYLKFDFDIELLTFKEHTPYMKVMNT